MNDNTRTWLSQLKVGDRVLVLGGNPSHNAPSTTSGRVFRITTNTIILQAGKDENSPGLKFDRATGNERPRDRWLWASLLEPTPANVAAHNAAWRKYKLVNFLRNTDYTALSLDTLDAIAKLVSC